MMDIPKGYKLAPVEPTEDMRLAYANQIRTGDYNPGTLVGGNLCAEIYTAMLAVAPAPPQSELDRVTAERDALQALLTAVDERVDERVDVLEGLLRDCQSRISAVRYFGLNKRIKAALL